MDKGKGPKLKHIAPLFYIPLLPMIQIVFRTRPRVRDAMFGLGICAAVSHGAYVVFYDLKRTPSPAR